MDEKILSGIDAVKRGSLIADEIANLQIENRELRRLVGLMVRAAGGKVAITAATAQREGYRPGFRVTKEFSDGSVVIEATD